MCFSFSEALQQIRLQLFVDDPDGDGLIPNANLYQELSAERFRHVGYLMAYSICFTGPAPNFMSHWIYNYFTLGLEKCLEVLPGKVSDTGGLCEAYNKVMLFVILIAKVICET